MNGIVVARKFSYGSRRAVEGSGGSSGQASSSASTAYPAGLLEDTGASRQALTSHRDAQQLGLFPTALLVPPAPPAPVAVKGVLCSSGFGWSPSTEAAAAERAAGVTGFALGSSVDSSGSSAASFRWFLRFL